MKALVKGFAPALLVAATLGVAFAKLPTTPPLDAEKIAEKNAKDAAAAAMTAAQQAKAEDRTVAHYIQTQKAKGKAVTPQMPPNAAELEAKAKEAASRVPSAAPAAPPQVAQTAPPVAVQATATKK